MVVDDLLRLVVTKEGTRLAQNTAQHSVFDLVDLHLQPV